MSDSDSWETPQELFDELNAEFNFILLQGIINRYDV